MANSAVPVSDRNEVFYDINVNSLAGHSAVVFVYPPNALYNSNGEILEDYIHNPNDSVVNVDIAFLRLDSFKDDTQVNDFEDGGSDKTNIAGDFYAFEANDYFFKDNGTDSNITAPSLIRSGKNPKIGEVIRIDANSTGATFENHSLGMHSVNVEKYSAIEVDGLEEGTTPSTMVSYAMRLEDFGIEDVAYRCFDTATIDVNVNTDITSANVIQAQVSHFDGLNKLLITREGFGERQNQYVTENSTFTGDPFGEYVGAVEICNIEREEGDLRYGDVEDEIPFIYTGTHYVFSNAELVTVEAGTTLPISTEVWGGDCFIGLHTFKISNSSYSLTDGQKDVSGEFEGGIMSNQSDRWGWWFDKTAGVADGKRGAYGAVVQGATSEDVSRPISVKGAAQTITVLLESEINPEYAEKSPNNDYNYAFRSASSITNLPVPVVEDAGQIRSNFKYRYNLDYNPENKYKIFLPFKTYDKNTTVFNGRLAYSDQKIYLSDTEGFDRFRALSIYDQDETYGAISSLTIVGDRVYSIQEGAVSYIPIIAETIQTADGGNMSVRSGEIIGKPIYIDTLYGTQHPKTVKVDKDSFYFVDRVNGEVCFVKGGELSLISRVNMESYFTTLLSGITLHSDLSAIYDNKKKEYWVTHRGNDTAVYSAITRSWVSRYPEDSSSMVLAGVRIEDKMYLIGIGSNAGDISGSTHDIKFVTVYDDGVIGKWWNTTYSPQVKFFVNESPEAVKIFDGYTIIATELPIPQTFDVYANDGNIGRSDLTEEALQYKQGTYRNKTFRITENSTDDGVSFSSDTSNKRARGTNGLMTINLHSTIKSGISAVLTKFRLSNRPI